MSGPSKALEIRKGPISIDGECNNLKKSLAKIRNKKQIENLGIRVNINPSYYACLIPKTNEFGGKYLAPILDLSKYNDSISSDSAPFCKSLTDSAVMRCNDKLLRNDHSNVGKSIWETISNLGVISRDADGLMIKQVEEMELIDKEGNDSKKTNSNRFR